MSKPEKIKVWYEAESISDEVDQVLVRALGSVGYECGDTGAFFDKESPIERDMEFVFTGSRVGSRCYLELWKEEVESLLDMTKISIEVAGEIDDPDDVLAWFYGISARLKDALKG